MRILAALRLIRVLQHLIYGLCVATALYPLVSQLSRRRLQKRWSQSLLSILGVRLSLSGQDCGKGLLVANHISWLDVFVISSFAPASFVCKSEVRNWPLVGLLCAKTDTVFLERGSRAAALRVSQTLAGKLGKGERVAVFPEGTTSEGASLMPFRGALLQSAIDSQSPIQPLALRYRDAQGETAAAASYCGETTFWQSLCAISSSPGMIASIEMLEPIPAANRTRKELCEESQALISTCLSRPLATLPSQAASQAQASDDVHSLIPRPV